MPLVIPDYLLISELLGYGAGVVLAAVLAMLVRRAPHHSPGTRLLVVCALLWNVGGLLSILLVVSGMSNRSMTVNMLRSAAMTGGAIFPVSFLLLWTRPNPESWQGKVNRWLHPLSIWNAVWISAFLFLCPFLGVFRLAAYSCSLNASLLLTAGALTQVRGRMSAAADRIYLALTLTGVWGATLAIFLLDQPYIPPNLVPALVIMKEQSPFLAVLGALFFFARFRSSDVLIKHSLRVTAAIGLGVWACFFIVDRLPKLAAAAPYPAVLRTTLGAAVIATLLVVFTLADQAIGRGIQCWILRQPDYGSALQQLWEDMAHSGAQPELFEAVDHRVSKVLDIAAVRVLRRAEIAGIESHAAANAGQWWELACHDPCRRAIAGFDIDVLVPVRVHGNVTHVMAIAPGDYRRSLLTGDLKFLQNVAGQIGSRLEALAHERERIERQSRESNLRRLAAQAELKALRAQINPHFLFNSLNTVADLIVTDPEKAEAMTVLLAKVFRHVLTQSDRQLTRVSEEMDFLRTYLRIEEVRFGDRLRVRMELDPSVSRDNIPSLILQPVVENAIKHGLAPKIGVGNLSIVADCHGEFVRLAVEDDGMGPAAPGGNRRNGNGVGLKIIAERLRALYDDRASLLFEKAEHAGSRVTILIPRNEAVV
ncbi:MAG: histidine kinase [Bryobacteraceae bacterium]|jgi:two-component system LytT family sensor kinase